MPTSNQIADRSNKRFNGKAKTDDNRAFFEEPYSKVEKIFPTEIWTQSDLIPSTPSGFTPTNGEEVGVVRYNEVTLTLVNGTTKAFYHPLLANIIPFDFGDGISYGWTITHSTNGEILFGQGDWEVIDGVLVFNGTLPFSGGVLTMSFYSYIGQTLEKYKGYYDTLENLIIDYPNNIVTPSDRKGWFTIVDSIFYIWSVSDNQWKIIGGESDLISIQVYNNTASTINKGSAVYLTGGNNGDKPHVDLADSSNANKMPALGIVKENINPSSEGQVAVSGIINFNSHGFTAGANLFINGLGALQETAPTGEGSLIQKIGKVVSPNIILVQGAFRSNATPNLNNGKIFLGNGSNQAVSTTLDTSVVPENTNLYYTDSRVQAVSINNVVEDTSPQLGGNLDVNGNDITGNPAIDGRRAIIVEADTSRTLSLEDAGDFIIATNVGDPTTIIIPIDDNVEFTTGTEIDFIQKTEQQLTIEADAGVTLNGVDRGSTAITAQWGGATIKKIDTDEWIIVGKINDVA